jgi:hypothetical protein
MAAVVITAPEDLDNIRTLLGLDSSVLSDEQIENTYIDPAESYIARRLADFGVGSTLEEIMSGDNASDKISLIEAVRNFIAYKHTPALSTSLNNSETVGPESVVQGATQYWKDQAVRFEAECDRYLGQITGFKRWRTL